MTLYIFILAVVLPNGMMEIKHSVLPECPEKPQVQEFMNKRMESGEIIKWAGTCAPFKQDSAEL